MFLFLFSIEPFCLLHLMFFFLMFFFFLLAMVIVFYLSFAPRLPTRYRRLIGATVRRGFPSSIRCCACWRE